MDRAKQLKEFDVLVGRAKRAGLTVHLYAEENLVILRVPSAPAVTPPPPPTEAPVAPAPPKAD